MGNEVSAAKPPAADGAVSEGGREDASWDKTMFADRLRWCGGRHGSEDKLTLVESGRVERARNGRSASRVSSSKAGGDVHHSKPADGEQCSACWILEPAHAQERHLPAHTSSLATGFNPEEDEQSGMLLMHQVPPHFSNFK
jgi:hypothetical protein